MRAGRWWYLERKLDAVRQIFYDLGFVGEGVLVAWEKWIVTTVSRFWKTIQEATK